MCKANFWRRPDRRRGVSFLRHHLLVLLNTVHKYGGMDTQLNTRKTCMTCTGIEQSFLRVSASVVLCSDRYKSLWMTLSAISACSIAPSYMCIAFSYRSSKCKSHTRSSFMRQYFFEPRCACLSKVYSNLYFASLNDQYAAGGIIRSSELSLFGRHSRYQYAPFSAICRLQAFTKSDSKVTFKLRGL